MNNPLLLNVYFKAVACIFMTILVGCAGNVATDAPPPVTEAEEIYRIGAGDQIRVDVWKNADVSSVVGVRPDGVITIPLIGDVKATGKTTEELGDEISELLKAYVKIPQVTVSVINSKSAAYRGRVRVTGAVTNQITAQHVAGMTVLDLILEAGGLTPFAAPNKAILYRKNKEGELVAYQVRLGDILNKGRLDTNYDLLPSDIMTVPERAF